MAQKHLTPIDLNKLELQNARIQNLASAPGSPVEGLIYYDTTLHQLGCYQNATWIYLGSGGGTVTAVSVASSNGFAGSSSGGATPILTLSTTITGLLKGNGTAISAATAGTDYSTPSSTDTLTNKTFNANGAGNSITNIETADFAANVIDIDGTLAANSDTRIASQKAIKTYVDALYQGIVWKASVRAATTATGTLATAYANGQVIDGVTLVTGDRILIKDQSAGAENGIYVVAASGAPTRATDADTAAEIKQAAVFVQEGTVNADNAFVLSNNGTITLGTTALVFVTFSSATVPAASTTVAGKVQLADVTAAETKSSTTTALTPASVVNFPIKRLFTIGDGVSTSIACTHSLGTKDVMVQVRDASTDAVVITDVVNTSTTVTTITFAVAPASNAYKVVIIG